VICWVVVIVVSGEDETIQYNLNLTIEFECNYPNWQLNQL
jgi:hypothetical protein